MATFTVTNVEEYPNGTPWAWGGIVVAIAGPQYDSTGHSLGGVYKQQTLADGSASVTGLEVGKVYTWTHPDGSQDTFQASTAGTFTLAALAGPFVPNGAVAVTQAALTAAITAQRGAAGGLAALDGTGLVPRAQLPNISGVLDVAGVANQATMLALTAPDPDTQLRVQRIDTPGVQWVLNPGLSPATLSNWLQEPFDPSGAASTVQANLTSEATRAQAAEAGKAPSLPENTTPLTASGNLTTGVITPIDTTTAAVTATLPAGTTDGQYMGARYRAGGNTATVTGNIAGVANAVIPMILGELLVFRWSTASSSWWSQAGNKPLASLDARFAPGGSSGNINAATAQGIALVQALIFGS